MLRKYTRFSVTIFSFSRLLRDIIYYIITETQTHNIIVKSLKSIYIHRFAQKLTPMIP